MLQLQNNFTNLNFNNMNIGVPKEIKNNENRVGLTPSGVSTLNSYGHKIFVQNNAGLGSGFNNNDYIKSGAKIVDCLEDVYNSSDMIVKVKEPLEKEYGLIKERHTLFTYFHFASSEVLTKKMMDSGATCIAYETITNNNKELPLLKPMSEVAGRLAPQQGSKYLEKPQGGKGILMGGVAGVLPAKVLILGGGIVGTEAAKMASGLGADVTILDINVDRLRYLSEVLPKNVKTFYSSRWNLMKLLPTADLVIGAVLIQGAKAPNLISKKDLTLMSKGSVLVDVAVDQGGCFETTVPTTHENPVYSVDGVLHYSVANMPGAVPHTSTPALTNATLSYAVSIANSKFEEIIKDPNLKKGVNIKQGKIYYKPVAKTFDLNFYKL